MNPQKKKTEQEKISVPPEVPIFPLPNAVLFPDVELPLYIFEPRYKKMLADCLSNQKFIGISLLKKGWEDEAEPIPSHDIIGVGYVRAVVENKDGTSYVILKGVERARITEYLQLEPYRIAKIRTLPERIENPKELVRLAAELRKLFIQKIRWISEHPEIAPRLPKQMVGPISLTHWASSVVSVGNPYLRQDLLETTNPNCRMRHLIDILKEEIHPPGCQN
ncbi:MAG TPA: LON peptidase substrate-binding domain-containing protein [bacterium]|nr:LON peptidase substrate-binding domain-containing protein [bacterium]